MIERIEVIHDEPDYFGHTHSVMSTLNSPDEGAVLKAVDRFCRNRSRKPFDCMHIVTEDRHYVVSVSGGRLTWFYYYGQVGSRTGEELVEPRAIKAMVMDQFED